MNNKQNGKKINKSNLTQLLFIPPIHTQTEADEILN